jgi:hypothetical protein
VEFFLNTVVGISCHILMHGMKYIYIHLCKTVEVKVYNKDMTVVSNCMWMDGGGKTRLSI